MGWAAYCAERNVCITGIYDVDHRSALMASLRLACSAFADCREAITGATLALMGKPVALDGSPAGMLIVTLGFAGSARDVRLDGSAAEPRLTGPQAQCSRVITWLAAIRPQV